MKPKHPKILFEQYILQARIQKTLKQLDILGHLERDYGFKEGGTFKITACKGRITIEVV